MKAGTCLKKKKKRKKRKNVVKKYPLLLFTWVAVNINHLGLFESKAGPKYWKKLSIAVVYMGSCKH